MFIIQEKEITYKGIGPVPEKGGKTCTIGIGDKERFSFFSICICILF